MGYRVHVYTVYNVYTNIYVYNVYTVYVKNFEKNEKNCSRPRFFSNAYAYRPRAEFAAARPQLSLTGKPVCYTNACPPTRISCC